MSGNCSLVQKLVLRYLKAVKVIRDINIINPLKCAISQMSHFYTPWKRHKTYGLTFSGSKEIRHWTKMGHNNEDVNSLLEQLELSSGMWFTFVTTFDFVSLWKQNWKWLLLTFWNIIIQLEILLKIRFRISQQIQIKFKPLSWYHGIRELLILGHFSSIFPVMILTRAFCENS